MSAAGTLASWLAVVFGAWAFAGALAAPSRRPELRHSARRALWMAALAAAVAAAILAIQLASLDLEVRYVARSVATNLPLPYRVAALWSFPSGAVLPTAALVGILGALATARDRSTLGIAAVAATIVALVAASAAAPPFTRLGWLPAEGLGMTPGLQHPASFAGRLLLSFLVAVAGVTVAGAADTVSEDEGRAATDPVVVRRLALTISALALVLAAAALGDLLTGSASSEALTQPSGGALVPAIAACALAWRARRGTALASLLGALGVLGSGLSVLLGGEAGRGQPATTALALVSLAAAAFGALSAARTAAVGVRRWLDAAAVALIAAGGAAHLMAREPGAALPDDAARALLVAGGILAALVASAGRTMPRAGGLRGVALTAAAAIAGGAAGAALAGGGAAAWMALAGASLGAAAVIAAGWDGDSRDGGRDRIQTDRATPRVMLSLAVALASLAAAGEQGAHQTTVRLASGGMSEVARRFAAPIELVHQGVSRYQSGNAHVVAVALEATRASRTDLRTVERREHVDGRESPVGAAMARPAVIRGTLETLHVRLVEVEGSDGVVLAVTSVPFGAAWHLSVIAILIAAALVTVPAAARAAPAKPSTPA